MVISWVYIPPLRLVFPAGEYTLTRSTSGGVQLSGTQPENKRQQLGLEPWLSLRLLQLQLCGRTEAGAKRQPPPTHEKISLD